MSESRASARPKRETAVYPNADVREAMRAAIPSGMEAPELKTIPFAYALVEGPRGQWTAVCLEGVTARAVEKLEPNGDAEPMFRASLRITRGIEMRTLGKRWGR